MKAKSKRISTRRSRNGESPIRTPAPTPSPVSTPSIRTPAPTPSPVPTPPIRTPAPTPPPVPTPPIRTSVPTPSSVFTPPIHTPTPAASPVPTAIFEPIPAHTSVSKPTPIPTPIPSPFLTPISTPIRRSVYEEPSPQRIEKLATPPTLSVIPAIASPKQPENFVASETSYHSIKSDDKDTESKVDQVIGRTTALEDLNTTKIRSKECIRIKECIAEDGTQITQIVRHLSIEEIFNPNNDQDNMESNNNNVTPTTSPSVQDLVAHLKNFLAAFQKQCVDVQCLQRLGATLVEALSKIDLCKGGDKVKIMKTIETQYIESEIYDVPNCMSTIPHAASTQITMENHQNVEHFPQCSRGNRENREVNLQTLSVHDENKFVDCCCEQDYSEDKAYDNRRAVDQRKKQLPHFPPPPPMTYTTYENEHYRLPSCDISSAYYEPIPKTSPASQRHTIDCSAYSRRCRSKVNDISASLSPEDRNIMSLDIGNRGNTDMSSNSNYQRFQQKNRFLPRKQSILRRNDCSCTRSQSSSGLQSTSSSKYTDSFGALDGIGACSCAGEKSHVTHDSKSSNSIYKDCTSNICPHTLQQRSVDER
uniref:Uncharacterized protein n=1 Tax=Glossina palpalis gambiensis TaxID=67801 RepID=A0A1B0C780_9MUSC